MSVLSFKHWLYLKTYIKCVTDGLTDMWTIVIYCIQVLQSTWKVGVFNVLCSTPTAFELVHLLISQSQKLELKQNQAPVELTYGSLSHPTCRLPAITILRFLSLVDTGKKSSPENIKLSQSSCINFPEVFPSVKVDFISTIFSDKSLERYRT